MRAGHLPADLGRGAWPGAESVPALQPSRQGSDGADLQQLAVHFGGTRRELAQRPGWSERTLYRRLKANGPS